MVLIKPGQCVKIPDGRTARVRDYHSDINRWRVRVRRKTSDSYEFVYFKLNELQIVDCPPGWMSVNGYNSYLKKTLAKMRQREERQREERQRKERQREERQREMRKSKR